MLLALDTVVTTIKFTPDVGIPVMVTEEDADPKPVPVLTTEKAFTVLNNNKNPDIER